ncbi:ribonuclease P protein component [Paenibacillus sp.]|uniref:ribonuclease P protein component n=1 Tax=Paenibacillus sp. TaxID=58172 RepID=UPI002810E4A0|nr:ribonuclease P protein component [Paenibacillus sp.]
MQKRLRLRKKEDFAKVFKHGKAAANHQFVVYVKHSQAAESFRFGVSVSKKVGNAVVRNRMRRRVKEIVRRMEPLMKPRVDIVCIVRKPALELDHTMLKKSIHHVFKRADLLQAPVRKQP